jgi:hypothetical protein
VRAGPSLMIALKFDSAFVVRTEFQKLANVIVDFLHEAIRRYSCL